MIISIIIHLLSYARNRYLLEHHRLQHRVTHMVGGHQKLIIQAQGSGKDCHFFANKVSNILKSVIERAKKNIMPYFAVS